MRMQLPMVNLYALLGTLLLFAAISKALLLSGGRAEPGSLLSEPGFLSLVIFSELLVAIWFFIFPTCYPAFTQAVGIVFFAVLAMFSIDAWNAGVRCNCFGAIAVSPVLTFLLDVFVMVLLWRRPNNMVKGSPESNFIYWFRRIAFVGFLTLFALPISLWSGGRQPAELNSDGDITGHSSFVVLRPWEWLGRELPLRKHTNLPPNVFEGDWVVVLYSSECGHCQQVVPAFIDRNSTAVGAQVAIVDIKGRSETKELFSGCDVIVSALSNQYEWFVQPPALLRVRNGTVIDYCPSDGDWFGFAAKASGAVNSPIEMRPEEAI